MALLIYMWSLPNDFNWGGGKYMMQFIVLISSIGLLSPVMTLAGALGALKDRDQKRGPGLSITATLAAAFPGLYLLWQTLSLPR
jgi:hypothetical protein